MSSELGSGYVAVFPTFKGMRRGVEKELQGAGNSGGRRLEKSLSRSGSSGGAQAGKGFKAMFGKGIQESVSQATNELRRGVAVAARAVSKSRLSEQDAAGKVRIAEAQLAEARKKHAADSSQVIRAEERLATASRRLEVAHEATTAATGKLKAAQDALSRSAEKARRGMGIKRVGKDLAGLLAPVTLIGRVLSGPLVRGARAFGQGFRGITAEMGGTASRMNAFGALAGRTFRTMQGGVQRAAGAVGRVFSRAWSTVARGASAVGTRVARVFAPAARWFAPMGRAIATSVSSAGRLFGGLTGVIGGVVRTATGVWRAGMDGLAQLTRAATSAMKGAFVGVGLAITATMTAALAGGWTRMTGIENAEAKLKGLGNSTEDVASIMDSALESVEGTAFRLDEAADIAASAVAAGIKPGKELTKYLKTTAAAAAAAGTPLSEMGSILNRVQTNGSAFTEEMNQLSDRGLPIWQTLADEMKVPQAELKKLVSEGKVDAATFTRAVETMSGDVAQAMGDTVSGSFANMRNSFSKLGATVLTPFQGLFKDLFKTVQDGVGAVSKALEPVVEVIADQIGERVLPVLERMRDAFKEGFTIDTGGLAGMFAALLPVLGGLAGMLGPILARLPLIGGMFAGITGPVGLFAGVLASLFLVDPETLADGIAGLIPQVTGLLTGLVSKVIEVLPTIVSGISSALTESLPVLIEGAGELVLALVSAITDALPALLGAFAEAIPKLADAITDAIPLIVGALTDLIPRLVLTLIDALPQIIQGALTLFLGIVTALVDIVPTLIQSLLELLPVLLQSLVAMLPALIEGALQLFLGLVLGLVEAIPQIIQAIVDLIPVLIETLVSMIPLLIQGAVDLFLGIVLGLAQALPEIIIALVGILPDLIAALIGMIPDLIVAAIDLFVALAQGLMEALPQILTTLRDEVGPALLDGILALGPALLDAGKELMGKVGQGIKDGIGKVGDAIGGAMDWIGGFFPHSPAKRGPFSGSGWRQLSKSGAAITEEFSAGIEAAQRSITMPSIVAGSTAVGAGSAASAGSAGSAFTQVNNFAHEDPKVAVDMAGQKMSSLARRAGV